MCLTIYWLRVTQLKLNDLSISIFPTEVNLTMISFNQWPTFSLEEKQRVNEVLGSGKVNYWTGTECNDFENEFAQFHGRKYGSRLQMARWLLNLR